MIPQNRTSSYLKCPKELKICFVFVLILLIQLYYFHILLHHKSHYSPDQKVYLPSKLSGSFDDITEKIQISQASQLLPTNGSLFCFVFTTPKYFQTRVPTIASTWLGRCDHGEFYTSKAIPSYVIRGDNGQIDVNIPYSTVFNQIPDDYELLFSKSLLALRFSYRMYPDFDWYYKADDDTYVIVEHLRKYLSYLDPSKSYYIGYRFNKHISHGYHSGGAGYVLSRAAMKSFDEADMYNDRKNCPPCSYEDVGIGRCLASISIFPMNAKNVHGQTLFHPNRPSLEIRRNDKLSIASDSISFHHLRPSEIIDLDLFAYQIENP